jgi:hypothetical protein
MEIFQEMRVICVLFLALFASSCDQQANIEKKIEPIIDVQPSTKKIGLEIRHPDIKIKENLKNIQIQQREINIRLERLDRKIKKKKKKRVKIKGTCLKHICSEGGNK